MYHEVTMYLSRVSPESGGLPSDPYALHQQVWHWFDPDHQGGKERDFLFRVDKLGDKDVVYLLSETPPTVGRGWEASTKEFHPQFEEGQRIQFKVSLNPTYKDADGKRRGVTASRMPYWMESRFAQIGAEVLGYEVEDRSWSFHQGRTGEVAHHRQEVTGVLSVTDPDKFLVGLRKGVGKARGFGYGMLMVKPL